MTRLAVIYSYSYNSILRKPTSAYGVRLYQNGSSLAMHCDKTRTHVISSIIHIAHEYDDPDKPWPIEIEDHNGQLHSVALNEGNESMILINEFM